MSDVVISPARGRNDPLLPGLGLLLVNPAEAAAARESLCPNWQRHFLFNSNLYVSQAKEMFWAGPCVGAPMAVLCLEKLIALGARRIISLGWCGALSSQLQVGDLVLPARAVSDEGTSGHYPVDGSVAPSPLVLASLRGALALRREKFLEGPVWTTDAPYRETREKVARLQREGVVAVEMECAALLQVAAFRRIDLAAVLLVSDLLWKEPWQPAFQGKNLRKRSRQLLAALFASLEKSAGSEKEYVCDEEGLCGQSWLSEKSG
ncbi:nucleoside phosphorylase [Thiovibrio sp. JS02]